jgi:hypothetical protein
VIAEMLRRTSALLAAMARSESTGPTPALAPAPVPAPAGPAAVPIAVPPETPAGDATAPKTGAFTRGREFQMLGVNYEWSMLAVDDTRPRPDLAEARTRAYLTDPPIGTGLRAGDRAPDAPGLRIMHVGSDDWLAAHDAATVTLFDALRPGWHTVLLFAAPDADAAALAALVAVARRQPEGAVRTLLVLRDNSAAVDSAADVADAAIIDTNGHAFTHYGISSDTGVSSVVIRPDSFVGAFACGPAGLEEYFGLVFRSL